MTAVSHGMVAALGIRILLSLAGSALLQRFEWVMLLFAAFLLFTGLRMLCCDSDAPSPALPTAELSSVTAVGAKAARGDESQLCVVRCVSVCVPLLWSDSTDGNYFARDATGKLCATRMVICVIGIAASDVLFAMDSVPVVLSLTTSPFVLVASQTLSLLWLRPLYFLLAALASYLDQMQQALAVILVLISLKIIVESAGFEVPLALFVGVLLGWRVLAAALVLLRRRHATSANAGLDDGEGPSWALLAPGDAGATRTPRNSHP